MPLPSKHNPPADTDFSERLEELLGRMQPRRTIPMPHESIPASTDPAADPAGDPFRQRLEAERDRALRQRLRVIETPEEASSNEELPDDLRFIVDQWPRLGSQTQQLILTMIRSKARRQSNANDTADTA